jgi:GDP-L-fucose synthase
LIEALRKQYGMDYVSLMPTNLYGPGDNFDLNSSHVLPSMIRKFHEAKKEGNTKVILWGTGTPLREFLHVDDLARAVKFMLENNSSSSLYNVGSGKDISISNLATMIQSIVGYQGLITWDKKKPDGTPRKLMDSTKLMECGWVSEIKLQEGITDTYKWFIENIKQVRNVTIK